MVLDYHTRQFFGFILIALGAFLVLWSLPFIIWRLIIILFGLYLIYHGMRLRGMLVPFFIKANQFRRKL